MTCFWYQHSFSTYSTYGDAPLVAAMSCGREITASIKPYSTASSAPMKKSLSVSCNSGGRLLDSSADHIAWEMTSILWLGHLAMH